MAWVAVHGSVNGPKLRSLGKVLGCSVFEALGILDFLWLWGLTNADENGHILSADEDDIARYLYGVGYGCHLDQHEIVKALIDTKWIDRNDGELCIHDWPVWQDQWYKAKDKLAKDVKRKRDAVKRSKETMRNEAGNSGASSLFEEVAPPDSISKTADKMETPENETPKNAPRYTPVFETFWDAYPRKACKGAAYKKYKARVNDGYTDGQLLDACKAYADECRRMHTDKQYIKHPATFLSDSMPFLDYLPQEPKDTEIATTGNPFAEYEDGDS